MRIPTLEITGDDDGSSGLANIRATQDLVEGWYYNEYGHEPNYDFEYQYRNGVMLVKPLVPRGSMTQYDREDFFQGTYHDLTEIAEYLEDNYPVDAVVILL